MFAIVGSSQGLPGTLVSAMTAVLLLAAIPGPAAARSTNHARCTFAETSTGLKGVLSLPPKSRTRGVILDVIISGSAQKQVQGTLRRGHQTFLTAATMLDSSTGASTSTVRFGAGFHHIREMSLSTADGLTFTGEVDGHQLEPFRVPADPKTLRFVGGGTLSQRIKVKHIVSAALRKLAQQGTASCTSSSAARGSSIILEFLGLSCDACNLACGASKVVCDGTAIAAGAASLAFVPSAALCLKEALDCSDSCATGDSCCPVPCAGGTPNASGPSTYCKGTCAAGAVCCGGASDPHGVCCDSSSDCCGHTCLDGAFAGDVCKDPQRGVFCFAGAGDICNDDLSQGACCPAATPVCRVPASDNQQQLCCATGGGDVCGPTGFQYCCPSTTPHCDGRECCAGSDVCGNGGDCCPSHTCLGERCCTGQVCTGILGNSTCCGEASVCNVRSGTCCPKLDGVVCGFGCCDTTKGECVNDACCPKAQACGSVCCPAGDECVDPNTGTCSSCPSGLNICTPQSPGPDKCCPAGVACCGSAGPGTGTVCCQAGQICCQDVPFDQCTDPADCRPIP